MKSQFDKYFSINHNTILIPGKCRIEHGHLVLVQDPESTDVTREAPHHWLRGHSQQGRVSAITSEWVIDSFRNSTWVSMAKPPPPSYFRSTKKPLVHHMTLFECSMSSYPGPDSSSWDVWVKSNGAVCNSNLLTPRDWDSCINPVAVWAIGATGRP